MYLVANWGNVVEPNTLTPDRKMRVGRGEVLMEESHVGQGEMVMGGLQCTHALW